MFQIGAHKINYKYRYAFPNDSHALLYNVDYDNDFIQLFRVCSYLGGTLGITRESI